MSYASKDGRVDTPFHSVGVIARTPIAEVREYIKRQMPGQKVLFNRGMKRSESIILAPTLERGIFLFARCTGTKNLLLCWGGSLAFWRWNNAVALDFQPLSEMLPRNVSNGTISAAPHGTIFHGDFFHDVPLNTGNLDKLLDRHKAGGTYPKEIVWHKPTLTNNMFDIVLSNTTTMDLLSLLQTVIYLLSGDSKRRRCRGVLAKWVESGGDINEHLKNHNFGALPDFISGKMTQWADNNTINYRGFFKAVAKYGKDDKLAVIGTGAKFGVPSFEAVTLSRWMP